MSEIALSLPAQAESSTREPNTSTVALKSREARNVQDNSFELTWTDEERTTPPNEEVEQASLPRADGGKDAWLFLAGCFMIEALVWGKLSTLFHSLNWLFSRIQFSSFV